MIPALLDNVGKQLADRHAFVLGTDTRGPPKRLLQPEARPVSRYLDVSDCPSHVSSFFPYSAAQFIKVAANAPK